MGEDCRSWLSHSHGDWQLPKLNSVDDDPLDLELGLGQPSGASRYMGSNANLISTTQPSPPHMQAGENKPHGWFYCFPRYRQAFVPLPNSGIMKQLPTGLCAAHDARPNSGQKRFIVFDQSADQKRLFVSSFAACPPIRPPPPPWSPATYEACNLSPEHPGIEAPNSHVLPLGDVNESHRADAGSELHEDTEELNALLYSDDDDDDDDDSEEDDEKSTGHSPSAVSNHLNSEWTEGTADTSFKRQKLSDGGYAAPSPLADSEKPNRYVEFKDYVDDAESSCADSLNARLDKMCSFAGDRRMRNKKIRETVRVLQSIIPRGKGDNAVVILDEAIQYLKSLKCKAKSLGFIQE